MAVPLAVPIALGGAEFLKWLNNKSATNSAADRQFAALDKAQGAIQSASDKAMGYQQTYLENAGKDFNQLRGLVQSGYFQTPYPKSFQPQNFAFNPSQGTANFSPSSYTPMGLPTMPQFQAPAPQAAPQSLPPAPSSFPIPTSPNMGAIQNFPQNPPANVTMPNRNQVPPPVLQNMDPNGTMFRSVNQPLTLQERMEIMRRGRGSSPYIPGYNFQGGLLGGRV
jgi:hypothetical protein